MALHHEVIIARLEAHRAALRATVGPVRHPHQVILDAQGHKVYPGQTMLDTVTGQIVEVQHAGTIETTTHLASP